MYVVTKTSLAQDRHIDQLMMCILYGICKVNWIEITFKQITDTYRLQPQGNSQTFRLVRLSNATKFGNIIKFYNTIFLTAVEPFLLEFATDEQKRENENVEDTTVNLRVYSPLKLHKSPQKIHNLLVSPRRTPLLLRDQANKSTSSNSIVLGSLKSPQSDFERINSTINKTTNKAKRRLDYATPDTATQVEPTLPSPAPALVSAPTPTPVTSLSTHVGQTRQSVPGVLARMRREGEEDYEDDEEEEDEVMEEEEEDDDDEDDEDEEDEGQLRVDLSGNRKRKQDAVVASLVEDSNKKTKRTR